MTGGEAMSNPKPSVERLIREIHDELSGADEWFVIVVGRNSTAHAGGNLHVSGSNIDQAAALREAVRVIEGGRS